MYLYINVCLCSVCMGVCSCVFSACMYLRVCSVCVVRVCCVYLCIDVQKCVYDPSLREFVHVCSCVLIGVYVFTCVPRVCRVCVACVQRLGAIIPLLPQASLCVCIERVPINTCTSCAHTHTVTRTQTHTHKHTHTHTHTKTHTHAPTHIGTPDYRKSST